MMGNDVPKSYRKTALITALFFNGTAASWSNIVTQFGLTDQLLYQPSTSTALVTTIEGCEPIGAGYWIARNPAGEIYPIRDDVFKATYEVVERE